MIENNQLEEKYEISFGMLNDPEAYAVIKQLETIDPENPDAKFYLTVNATDPEKTLLLLTLLAEKNNLPIAEIKFKNCEITDPELLSCVLRTHDIKQLSLDECKLSNEAYYLLINDLPYKVFIKFRDDEPCFIKQMIEYLRELKKRNKNTQEINFNNIKPDDLINSPFLSLKYQLMMLQMRHLELHISDILFINQSRLRLGFVKSFYSQADKELYADFDVYKQIISKYFVHPKPPIQQEAVMPEIYRYLRIVIDEYHDKYLSCNANPPVAEWLKLKFNGFFSCCSSDSINFLKHKNDIDELRYLIKFKDKYSDPIEGQNLFKFREKIIEMHGKKYQSSFYGIPDIIEPIHNLVVNDWELLAKAANVSHEYKVAQVNCQSI